MNNNKSIMTDFYELTMAQTYFDSGKKDEEVYFDINNVVEIEIIDLSGV